MLSSDVSGFKFREQRPGYSLVGKTSAKLRRSTMSIAVLTNNESSARSDIFTNHAMGLKMYRSL